MTGDSRVINQWMHNRAAQDRFVMLNWYSERPRLDQLQQLMGAAAAYSEVYGVPDNAWNFVLGYDRWKLIAEEGFQYLLTGPDELVGEAFDQERRLTLQVMDRMVSAR